jgi:hypothetical protein
MKRSPLVRKTPMARGTAPMKARARKARTSQDKTYLSACRGQLCFLSIAGVCRSESDTVVPCHANWADYGKGMGIKAKDIYTVPGCMRCHAELDQGFSLTKEAKRAVWEWAYTRWSAIRDRDAS